jgi:hypothetical protein
MKTQITVVIAIVAFTALHLTWADRPQLAELGISLSIRDTAQDETLEPGTLQVEAVYRLQRGSTLERRTVIRRMTGSFRLRTFVLDSYDQQFDLEAVKIWGPQGQELRAYRGEDLQALIAAAQTGGHLEAILTRDESAEPLFRVTDSPYAWALAPTHSSAVATVEYHNAIVARIRDARPALNFQDLEHQLDTVYLTYAGYTARLETVSELAQSQYPYREPLMAQINEVARLGEQHASSIQEALESGIPRLGSLSFDQAVSLLNRLYPQCGSTAFVLALEKLGELPLPQNQQLFELANTKHASAAAVALAQRIYQQTPGANLTLLGNLAERIAAGDLRDSLITRIASRYQRVTFLGLQRLLGLMSASDAQAELVVALASKIPALSGTQVAALSGAIQNSEQRLRAASGLLARVIALNPSETQALLALFQQSSPNAQFVEQVLGLTPSPSLETLTQLSSGLSERAQREFFARNIGRFQGVTLAQVFELVDRHYASESRDSYLVALLAAVPLPNSDQLQSVLPRFSRANTALQYANQVATSRGSVSMKEIHAVAVGLGSSLDRVQDYMTTQANRIGEVQPDDLLVLADLFYATDRRDVILEILSGKITGLSGIQAQRILNRASDSATLRDLGNILAPKVSPANAEAFLAVVGAFASQARAGYAWIVAHHSRFTSLTSEHFYQAFNLFYASESRDEAMLQIESRFNLPNRADVTRLIRLAHSASTSLELATRMLSRAESQQPVSASDLRAVVDHFGSNSSKINLLRAILLSRASLTFESWYPIFGGSIYASDSGDALLLELIGKTTRFSVEQIRSLNNLFYSNLRLAEGVSVAASRVQNLTGAQLIQLAQHSLHSASARDRFLLAGIEWVTDLSSTSLTRISEQASSSSARESILSAGLTRLSR